MQRQSGDCQMREVAADAFALLMHRMRALGWRSEVIAEGQVVVHVVADRLHALPAGPVSLNSDQARSVSLSVSQ